MDHEITFAPRPASRRVVTLPSFLLLVGLTIFALCFGALMTGCTSSDREQVINQAGTVPQPDAGLSQTIRVRVAAVVKKEVQAHPSTAPWVNGLAQVCFKAAGYPLPAPATLQTLFGVATTFAPPEITRPVSAVLDLYTQDYQAASAVQGGGKAYLTLLGQGIQDGVKAAGVSDAP